MKKIIIKKQLNKRAYKQINKRNKKKLFINYVLNL